MGSPTLGPKFQIVPFWLKLEDTFWNHEVPISGCFCPWGTVMLQDVWVGRFSVTSLLWVAFLAIFLGTAQL